MLTKKSKLIDLILETLNNEIASLTLSAKAAHEAATHEESKAEDSHDTRGLEASYLAGAQQARIQSLMKVITFFQLLKIRNFQPTDPVSIGACIDLKLDGKIVTYFLASHGGGISVSIEGKPVQVITPLAPLGEALLDKFVGDSVEVESRNINREYEIILIW